eukprot:6176529-Pleurochrysis_carterae.AAC.11
MQIPEHLVAKGHLLCSIATRELGERKDFNIFNFEVTDSAVPCSTLQMPNIQAIPFHTVEPNEHNPCKEPDFI